jgi:DNA primase large subunit
MRACILEALNKQLEGGEGHAMRIAIVGEALAAGKNREEIIHMFEGQDDFDESTTAKNVDYLIEEGYHPWGCETLHDKCSTFVDCDNCPRKRFESSEGIAEPATSGVI